jgi:hypothetical protein
MFRVGETCEIAFDYGSIYGGLNYNKGDKVTILKIVGCKWSGNGNCNGCPGHIQLNSMKEPFCLGRSRGLLIKKLSKITNWKEVLK